VETISTRTVYAGHILTLRLDQVRLSNGNPHTYEVIDHRDAVTIVPIDGQGQIWFVRQYRHPAGKVLLELPAGVAEAGEDVLVSAQRELREEIGMQAGQMEKVGGFWMAPGYTTEYMHVFIARQLAANPLPGDEDESIQVERIPIVQALAMAENAQLEDAKSLVALMWARQRLA